jgi:cellulose synthase/poly-beta-1,6-N-acetylglucosamine synthase-like glycosyltransferase
MHWIFEIIILSVYSFASLFNFTYSLNQVNLTVLSKRKQKSDKFKECKWNLGTDKEFPMVTVQLPVYNELYVIERLMDAVCSFHWPKDKLEIQVLDDSTDETSDIISRLKEKWSEKGIEINHLQRKERIGYKAGALAYGTELAKGEFIALFDADFIPNADFLLQTIPFFKNEKAGVVQTRWGHINADYSLLTKLQALGLNSHFYVENKGRHIGNHFLNFNGTAGVWRRKAIEEAGGWQYDTLTEDLDLSYRAQLKGWEICFRTEIESPAELPVVISAVKSQQYRWTKGAAEGTVKLLPSVMRAKIPFKTKIHGFFHLMNSFVFLCMAVLAALSIPVLFIKYSNPDMYYWVMFNAVLFAGTYINLAIFYWNGFKENKQISLVNFIRFCPQYFFLICIALGISVHNTIAVFEGFIGKKTPFVRTPKYNILKNSDGWKHVHYVVKTITAVTVMEFIMILYFVFGIYLSVSHFDYVAIPFHLMQIIGYGMVLYYTFKHRR